MNASFQVYEINKRENVLISVKKNPVFTQIHIVKIKEASFTLIPQEQKVPEMVSA